MFCPKCGNSDQQPETFCRKCGAFLPDFDKAGKRKKPPAEHITANAVLSAMTIVVSFTLAALLYAILAFRPDTHALIYITAGFLLAIGGWHIQTFIRTLMLRKQLKEWGRLDGKEKREDLPGSVAPRSLGEPDLSSHIPASVTEVTTRNLAGTGNPLP
jgi:cytochrome c biogenesis protein CcdA